MTRPFHPAGAATTPPSRGHTTDDDEGGDDDGDDADDADDAGDAGGSSRPSSPDMIIVGAIAVAGGAVAAVPIYMVSPVFRSQVCRKHRGIARVSSSPVISLSSASVSKQRLSDAHASP